MKKIVVRRKKDGVLTINVFDRSITTVLTPDEQWFVFNGLVRQMEAIEASRPLDYRKDPIYKELMRVIRKYENSKETRES